VVRTSARTPSEELQVYHNAADVMVLPFSAMLTSGTVILALSWKKPIIVPALGCLPELITDDIGIMYDPTDCDALRQAMLDIRQRDLQAMGERAHRRMQELSWEHIAVETLRAYQES
jgi:glycosyltransferase involved in cell wall biosynthesis